MSKSVVVFGLASSGKSTCVGYMYAKTMENKGNWDFEREVDNIKLKLGKEYDKSRDYGYLVDKGREEQLRTAKPTLGTTKSMHLKPIEFNGVQVVVIDTPGSQHKARQRETGMYYGDIGIFCVEMRDIISEEFSSVKGHRIPFLGTLALWIRYKKDVIIALTKSDECDFSEDSYNQAREVLKVLCPNNNILAVVPISIEVASRVGHNIYEKSTEMPWYTGPTLGDAIQRELLKTTADDNYDIMMFKVDHENKISKAYTGKNWMIKVIRGTVQTDKYVQISPVKKGNEYGTVIAKVKTIRLDLSSEYGEVKDNIANEGDFIGIDLSDITYNGRHIAKKDFETCATSCGFPLSVKCLVSDKLRIRVSRKNSVKVNINRQLELLWFGRSVTVKIIKCNTHDDSILIDCLVISMYISVAKEWDDIYRNVILKYDTNSKYEDPYFDGEFVELLE